MNWRHDRTTPSLENVHHSVRLPASASQFRRMLTFLGPGYIIATGYMDPGNWATDIAGGSGFGYTLLCVVLFSNLLAIFLQALALRLGIVTGRDLAQACRDHYPRPISLLLWLLAELAIIATDLAEVIGTAIALQLLFGIPLVVGILASGITALLVLGLQSLGFRWLELLIFSLMSLTAICFIFQMAMAQPVWADILSGFIPTQQLVSDPALFYLAIGIIGATVMPHNLFLHSGIVQTRQIENTDAGKREAIRFATIDSTVALMLALFVNASILILAAATFHASGNTNIATIEDAYHLLAPLLGTSMAAILFGTALLACGINSTLACTLAGQIVMEGFLNLRMKYWQRQLLTRTLAIVPALLVAVYAGNAGTAQLLVLSQVLLGLQLPFAVVPLVLFTSQRSKMGAFVSPLPARALATAVAGLLIILNIYMLIQLTLS